MKRQKQDREGEGGRCLGKRIRRIYGKREKGGIERKEKELGGEK